MADPGADDEIHKALLEKARELRGRPMLDPAMLGPPWVVVPNEAPESMAWRMGGGEDYVRAFVPWFRSLDGQTRSEFMHKHPEPEDWRGYYGKILTPEKD